MSCFIVLFITLCSKPEILLRTGLQTTAGGRGEIERDRERERERGEMDRERGEMTERERGEGE